jgi:hypothetical protein
MDAGSSERLETHGPRRWAGGGAPDPKAAKGPDADEATGGATKAVDGRGAGDGLVLAKRAEPTAGRSDLTGIDGLIF